MYLLSAFSINMLDLTEYDHTVKFNTMTEEEVICFLRIPEVSKANNYHNVIENLKRMHDLPCIHICKKPLYPLDAVRSWIEEKLSKEQK